MTEREKIKGDEVADSCKPILYRFWPMIVGIFYSLLIGSFLMFATDHDVELNLLSSISTMILFVSIGVLLITVKHRLQGERLYSYGEKEISIPFISLPLALSGCVCIFISLSFLAELRYPGEWLWNFFEIRFGFSFLWWLIFPLLVGISLSLLSVHFEQGTVQDKTSWGIGLLLIFLIPLHGIIFLEKLYTGKNFLLLVYSIVAIVLLCIISGYHSSKMLEECNHE